MFYSDDDYDHLIARLGEKDRPWADLVPRVIAALADGRTQEHQQLAHDLGCTTHVLRASNTQLRSLLRDEFGGRDAPFAWWRDGAGRYQYRMRPEVVELLRRRG